MTATIITLSVIAILLALLERNHRRNAGPHSPLAGRSDVYDADLARVRAELATHELIPSVKPTKPSRPTGFFASLAYAVQRPPRPTSKSAPR